MFQIREHGSGLVLAEDGMDEKTIAASLKELGPWALQKRRRDEAAGGVLVYKVVHIPSGMVAFTWIDDHCRPLPLSSGLVDEFKRHLLGTRGADTLVDADEHNRRHVERLQQMEQERKEAVWEEWRPRLRDGRVTVQMGGQQPRYWKRRPR